VSELRTGFTTGACAAAAAKAAVLHLNGSPAPAEVEIAFPDGQRFTFTPSFVRRTADGVEAGVRKEAGDDPDVTDGVTVVAAIAWTNGADVEFAAGNGVGTVTKRGLQIPPGEPAINPGPRRMIAEAVREVTDRGVRVTISVAGGGQIAKKTFNPRLGIVGGISILGTTGIVRPYSNQALRDALKCSLDVAAANGITSLVLAPGNIGRKAAERHFKVTPEQVVEVSNEWGFMLDCAAGYSFERILVLGHPGKLAKLCDGQWDTHSSKSDSAVPVVARFLEQTLGRKASESTTVEGLFEELNQDDRQHLAKALAAKLRETIQERLQQKWGLSHMDAQTAQEHKAGGLSPIFAPIGVSAVLVNMNGDILGSDGDLGEW
jgi:cobalt-precorrin-5B (C1)-methyltransferase